jgi:ABC-type transporter MlaC component
MMHHRLSLVSVLAALMLVLGLLGLARVASAGSATDQLRPEIERVIATLQDPALKGEGRTEERRQAIRVATDGVFDWTEMARRSLGRHWAQRTEAEQRSSCSSSGSCSSGPTSGRSRPTPGRRSSTSAR